MSTLVWFVILYMAVSIAIGLYAATRVKGSADYVVAGRRLPLYIVIATVFATWFGSETVLGISAKFAKDGLKGVIEDPFGSSMCLILVGVLFARPLYRMVLLTIGDYYRIRYNRTVEVLASACIVMSYLGWVAAQIKALGLVFNILSQGAVSPEVGMMVGAAIVLAYTLWGGMWSVALTDFFQMIIIVAGLLYIAWVISDLAGGAGKVIASAADTGKFEFWPALETKAMLAFVAAWITMMFGSIPQQDVFQRVMSAKTENTAVAGSVIGGSLYFCFAFIPMFLAYAASLVDPALFKELVESDSQQILPQLILKHTPVFAQVMFFGALLSAIMSTASATLLAPSATFTENILKPVLGTLTDKQLLRLMRTVVVIFAVIVTAFAMYTTSTIYDMVGNAYKVTLVAAFVPLFCGVYWKGATTQGALFAIFAGLTVWIGSELFNSDGLMPAQLAGFLASIAGMVVGSFMPSMIARRA